MFRGSYFMLSAIFNGFGMTWTQHRPGIEPLRPLRQCWVPPSHLLFNQQGLFVTRELHQEPTPRTPMGYSSEERVGYSDADWDGDLNDYKSTSRYMFQIYRTVVSWRCMPLSTAEAEYFALASLFRRQSGCNILLVTWVGSHLIQQQFTRITS